MKKIITLLLVFTSLILNAQESYYSDVDLNLTGLALKDALAVKITQTHTNFLNYTPSVWEASIITDANSSNTSEVVLIYGWENGTDSDTTNDRERDNSLQDNGSGAQFVWNREHVFSKSLATPKLITDDPGPGTDAHNLRPADRIRNSTRSNTPFATGSGIASGNVANGWYPGDEWKGDVARIVMYMYLRYNGDGSKISETKCLPSSVGIGNSANTPDDMLDLFLQWNAEDPVSEIERKRNTYHENTTNQHAQGNRNPFIDNPRLATRIWGGPEAEDVWGIYTNSDTQAPTAPTSVEANNITTFSADISWTASTDNVGVTSYDVYVNGSLSKNTTSTSTTISGLNSNTDFTVYVIAKDVANNESAQSSTISFTTLEDTDAPSIPTSVDISNESGTTFVVSWTASTDNTAVTGYDVFVDGNLNSSVTETNFTVTGLTISTSYSVQVLAKDAVNNKSALSSAITATTTDGSTTTANELFFSEYFEGSFGTNKALEIANVTSSDIDLSTYSIKRNGNGGSSWSSPLNLSGTIKVNDVFVIINESTTIQKLIDEADYLHPNNSGNSNGEPINFNGNDPIGLFKNDVLIDIIGVFNNGSSNFAKDVTLRRKPGIIKPNTTYDLNVEWDEFKHTSTNNFEEDFGQHSASLSIYKNLFKTFTIYPNPVKETLYIKLFNQNDELKSVVVYDLQGKEIFTLKKSSNEIDVSDLNNGVYILKVATNNGVSTRKIVKK